jgi:hypothetical protein
MSTEAATLLDELLDELIQQFRPGSGTDWHLYEAAKRRLAGIYEPGSHLYESAIRKIVYAIEMGRK